MATPALLGKDVNGATNFFLPVNNNGIWRTTLAANTYQQLTIPFGYTQAVFSYSNGVDVWVEFKTGTATLPTGAFLNATSELNPIGRYGLIPGETLAFISPTTAYVEVYFAP